MHITPKEWSKKFENELVNLNYFYSSKDSGKRRLVAMDWKKYLHDKALISRIYKILVISWYWKNVYVFWNLNAGAISPDVIVFRDEDFERKLELD